MKIIPKYPSTYNHLAWAIKRRAHNQVSALRLLRLLSENEEKIIRFGYHEYAQDLVGVAFSLWRAAFLADEAVSGEDSFRSALRFLEIVISDNAIGFPQDKKEKHWTFTYYMDVVRFTFLRWQKAKKIGHIVPKWSPKPRNPRLRWIYGQDQLEKAIDNLETELRSLR